MVDRHEHQWETGEFREVSGPKAGGSRRAVGTVRAAGGLWAET